MFDRRMPFLFLCLCAKMVAAETPSQPQPPPPAVKADAISDWTPYLNDFMGADKAKQEAAAKVFAESGQRGYSLLAPLIKGNNKETAARVNAIREQIETRTMKIYQETAAEHEKLRDQPLTAAALESARQAYLRLGIYSIQPGIKQYAFQTATQLQQQTQQVEEARLGLEPLDAQMKNAGLKGLARAAVQTERATALQTLQRHADMLAAAQDAAASSGKDGRFTPGALKLQIEAHAKLNDAKNQEAICRHILAEHPRSLEVKFAHGMLIGLLSASPRWDAAIAQAKTFYEAFPVDKDAQETIYGVLTTLMDDERDYRRVAPLAEWLMDRLPPDRLQPEIPKYSGGCNEYILKDYAKAGRAYAVLRDNFADAVSADDMNAALARVKAKSEGKFPREPQDGDDGPAGALARFLKAVRARDTKAVAAAVPKESAEEIVELVEDSMEELVPSVVFADYILTKVELNETKDSAKLLIDYYEASAAKPRPITQEAVKEDGQWKIQWEEPEEPPEEGGINIPLGTTPQPK